MNRDIQIINYIYGEMSPEEKEAFIREMNNDPALAKEVDDLVLTHAIMQVDKQSTTVETKVQPTTSANQEQDIIHLKDRLNRFKWLTGLAASIALGAMLLAGSMMAKKQTPTTPQVAEVNAPATDYITKDDLEDIVARLHTSNQQDWASFKQEINKSVAQVAQQKSTPTSTLDEQKIMAMMANLSTENTAQRKLFEDALRQYSDVNKKDFATLVQAINNQRGKDMQYINQSLNQISSYILDQTVTADNSSINAKYKVD